VSGFLTDTGRCLEQLLHWKQDDLGDMFGDEGERRRASERERLGELRGRTESLRPRPRYDDMEDRRERGDSTK
jgi:hypothetical protein